MAQYEPEMFNQLMADMDEERLNQFIEEQELQARINFQAEHLRQEVDGFSPEFEEAKAAAAPVELPPINQAKLNEQNLDFLVGLDEGA